MTVFKNVGSGKKKIAFGAPYPGKIIPIHLKELGGELLAQKDSFLCAAKGVSVGIAFTEAARRGLLRRRRIHPRAPAGRRVPVHPRGRHHLQARAETR